jgi:type VI secretion system (T6SS) baseplate-like injector VgrG
VIEQLLAGMEASIDQVDRKMTGVMVGTVINPLDVEMQGRVQVRLNAIDSLDLSCWARVAQPMAALLSGSYFVPNVGDEVLVAFEHGDVNAPYIIGCLWNLAAPPPLPSPLPQIRAIRTPAGNQIVTTEAPPSVTIQTAPTPPAAIPAPPTPTGPYQTFTMNPTGIQAMTPTTILLQVGPATTLLMTPESITLTVGTNGIAITKAGTFLVGGGANVSLAGGNASVIAPMVRINS